MFIPLFILLSSISTICTAAEIKREAAIAAGETEEAAAIQALVKHDLPPVRSILIFMDTSEEEWGAVSSDLIAALEQKAAPIIVSDSLLRGIITQPTLESFVDGKEQEAQENPDNEHLQITANYLKNFLVFFNNTQEKIKDALPTYKTNQDTKAFLAAINQNSVVLWHDYWNDSYKERIRSLLSFNPEEWVIEYTSGFYILIPKAYIPTDISSSSGTKTLTPQQLSLGLKLGCCIPIPANLFFKSIIKTPLSLDKNFEQFLCEKHGKECISPLFITRSEYTKHGITVDKIPQWIVYVFGHGSLEGDIAGFDATQFQQLLDFCDTKIVTKLFMYKTCYGASSHTAHLFLDQERKREKRIKNYSFPIMCGAIPDVTLYGQWPTMGIPGRLKLDDIDLERGVLRLHTFPDFKQSFKLASDEVIGYEKLAHTLIPAHLTLENLMLVKPAYLEWTSLVNVDNVTVSIPKTMALTRIKPLTISTLVKKGAPAPKAILLYAHHIPFELILDTTPLPKLISMIPGKCFHVIDKIKISIPSLDFANTIADFFPDAPKLVWIKEVKGSNPTPTENLIIDITDKKNYTVYTTRAGEYVKRSVRDGINQRGTASEDPADNYVPRYANLLRMNLAYRTEEKEHEQIQAIAKLQERKKTETKEREAKKGKE